MESMTNHKDLRAPSPAGVEPSPFSSRSHTPIPRVTSPAMDGPSRPLTPHERPSRYPSELGARRSAASSGHVPLHRRGTSRTYERLEDLLAEAGYKDTRIFTPDAERVRAGAKAEGESPPPSPSPAPHALPAVTKGPVDTVVGFLTGLIPNRAPSPSPDSHDRRNHVSPVRRAQLPSITSPIPGHSKLPHARSALPSAAASPLAQYSRLPPASSAGPSRAPSYATLPQPHAAGIPNRRAYTTPAYGPSSSSNLHQDDNAPTPTLRPRPSVGGLSYSEAAQARRALSQLRSMASVPNMAQRRRQPANIGTGGAGGPRRAASSRTPLALVHARDADADADTALLGAAGPVPASWLEAVARAVLGVSAPALPRRRRRSPSPHRRHGRGGGRTSGVAGPNSTAVGVSRGRAPAPGTYLARAPSAPGAVSVARVVCQSAPGSRAVSRSRAVGSRGRRSGRRDKAGAPPLPVLARTLVEHDPLWAPLAEAPAASVGTGPPSAPAVIMTFASPAPDRGRGADEDAEDSTDDEDGRELDLTRMLIPARRQHSIRSLRQHLSRPAGVGGAAGTAPPTLRRAPSGASVRSPPRVGLGLQISVDEDAGEDAGEDAPLDGERGEYAGPEVDGPSRLGSRAGTAAHRVSPNVGGGRRQAIPAAWAERRTTSTSKP